MKMGLLQRLRQIVNQGLAYLYAVAFVLIGGRVVLFVQQTYGAFWPCHYVEAWWQTQGSQPTVMHCLDSGRESTVVLSLVLAMGLVLTLMRQLEWRLRLVACVAALYVLLRIGYVINALGSANALATFGHALFVIRFELLGMTVFALLAWLFRDYPGLRQILLVSIALVLAAATIVEFVLIGQQQAMPMLKALALTLPAGLLCWLLGKLPGKTARTLLGNPA